MFNDFETRLLQQAFNYCIRPYYSRRHLHSQDYDDYINEMWVLACKDEILQEELRGFIKSSDRIANCATNRNRHSVSVKKTSNVQENKSETPARRKILTFTNSDMEDLESNYEKDIILGDLLTSTIKSRKSGGKSKKPTKYSNNFWQLTFPNLSYVNAGLKIINPDLDFKIFRPEKYEEGIQLQGTKGGFDCCPICTGRKCFTIRKTYKGWTNFYCQTLDTGEHPNYPDERSGLRAIFNLFIGGPIHKTQKNLCRFYEKEIPKILSGDF